MEAGDFVEPEVGIAVALTAAFASPGVRKTLRKSAVYGLAGAMLAGDAAGKFFKAVGSSVKSGAHAASQTVSHATETDPETVHAK